MRLVILTALSMGALLALGIGVIVLIEPTGQVAAGHSAAGRLAENLAHSQQAGLMLFGVAVVLGGCFLLLAYRWRDR